MNRTVELDVERMVVTPEGVEGFVCPIGRSELVALKDHLLVGITRVVREHCSCDGSLEVEVLAQQLVAETLGCLQADVLMHRLAGAEACGVSVKGRFWKAAAEQRAPEASPLLAILERGFVRKGMRHYLQKIFGAKRKPMQTQAPQPQSDSRAMQNAVSGHKMQVYSKSERIHSRMLNPWNLRRHVIATKRGGLLAQHAETEKKTVTFARHEYWFTPLNGQSLACLQNVISPLLETEIIKVVEQGMLHLDGRSLPGHLSSYLSDFIQQGARRVRCHLDRLLASPGRLPEQLWTGSSGNIWDRMLRVVVRETGGTVTGHDHAGGFRYIHRPHLAVNELMACDQFVTYSQQQARWFRSQASDKPLFSDHMPAIKGLDAKGEPLPRVVPRDRLVKKVMYVGGIYRRDAGLIGGSMHDVAQVDFEARLLAKLQDWGLEVLFKSHPENTVPLPGAFFQELGAQPVGGTFEQVCTQADVALFLMPYSSTFPFALRSGMPMALMDFGHALYEPDAKDLLERRCPVVYGSYDQRNHAQVDWEALHKALFAAPAAAHNVSLEQYAFYDKE